MLNISKNGKFKICQFQITGSHIEEKSIGVKLIPDSIATISLMDVSLAVMDCFDEWDVDSRKLAPTIYFELCIHNSWYNFKVNWELELDDYLRQIASQFIL